MSGDDCIIVLEFCLQDATYYWVKLGKGYIGFLCVLCLTTACDSTNFTLKLKV